MSETEDPKSYLQTGARIIAEDGTHVVIAVRVEKSFFARNLWLLAALADLMPAKDRPGIAEPPRGTP